MAAFAFSLQRRHSSPAAAVAANSEYACTRSKNTATVRFCAEHPPMGDKNTSSRQAVYPNSATNGMHNGIQNGIMAPRHPSLGIILRINELFQSLTTESSIPMRCRAAKNKENSSMNRMPRPWPLAAFPPSSKALRDHICEPPNTRGRNISHRIVRSSSEFAIRCSAWLRRLKIIEKGLPK